MQEDAVELHHLDATYDNHCLKIWPCCTVTVTTRHR